MDMFKRVASLDGCFMISTIMENVKWLLWLDLALDYIGDG